ncbi:A/G-specific adenine glycosylase [Coraliomargarita sp. SDUM461004]|uniref:A/G-specific adenine glycosylase n=1 Tax=Thalassobacterium sedimentorum TaxID=3041258 RepID=A0ABU1AH09_9BACT|nr:A/G-specific adenine glycosylase [Coraliomargarita sp. SDUM461004]MDQ8193150.1 A/G-specific adenine glycosylase [Coraliomargarita sp. SDUM461004]
MDLLSKKITFRHALAQWYAKAQRPLPWRTQPSLYRTVVSELMAQQTQIKTMLPYFERWMRRFPNFTALAEASSEDVLKHWEGLGYYSRARNLHKLAQQYIAAESKPRTQAAWQALPGIGPYTSAAISSIALGEAAAVVDGNVVRILARLNDDARVFKNNGEAVKAFTTTADALLDTANPGQHNQAMMELGATLCLKHKPLCTVCPVATFCAAKRNGTQDARPKIERKASIKIEINRAWVLQGDKLLLHRIAENSSQLAGQYELPTLEAVSAKTSKRRLLASRSRAITHRRIKEHIYQTKPKRTLDHSIEWIAVRDLPRITLSGPHRRWINELMSMHNSVAGTQ